MQRVALIHSLYDTITQTNMKTKSLFYLTAFFAIAIASCKKTSDNNQTGSGNNTTPKISTLGRISQAWTLKETYEDGKPKTSNGTEQYRFDRAGNFSYYYNSKWENVGTYSFFDKDSNTLNILMMGSSIGSTWTIKSLTDTELKTEFYSGTKKMNYNFSR